MDGSSDSEALNENWEPIQHQNFVVIRDDYFLHESSSSSVFPPTHHEDLPVPPPDVQSSEAGSESSEWPAVSDLRARVVAETVRCLRLSCEVLKAKVISRIFRFGSSGASLGSVLPVTAMAALLVLSLFYLKMRLPWRRRTVAVHRDNEERLLLLIKRKDEKISQLLLQIAQMNEALSARRRVPVVRIK